MWFSSLTLRKMVDAFDRDLRSLGTHVDFYWRSIVAVAIESSMLSNDYELGASVQRVCKTSVGFDTYGEQLTVYTSTKHFWQSRSHQSKGWRPDDKISKPYSLGRFVPERPRNGCLLKRKVVNLSRGEDGSALQKHRACGRVGVQSTAA